MEIHGSIHSNLVAAVSSARRLRTHPVHADTLQYWGDLLHHARRELAADGYNEGHSLQQLVLELEEQLADRPS